MDNLEQWVGKFAFIRRTNPTVMDGTKLNGTYFITRTSGDIVVGIPSIIGLGCEYEMGFTIGSRQGSYAIDEVAVDQLALGYLGDSLLEMSQNHRFTHGTRMAAKENLQSLIDALATRKELDTKHAAAEEREAIEDAINEVKDFLDNFELPTEDSTLRVLLHVPGMPSDLLGSYTPS
jgi:hypothetical protein